MSIPEIGELPVNFNYNLTAEIGLTNWTNFNYTETGILPNPLVMDFYKLFAFLVAITGLCGNSLVIYVVLRFSKMQTVTNMYLFNLALADEIFLSGLPVLMYIMVVGRWPFGETACRVYYCATSINQFTSSLLLTVMSADRYIAVCHPLSSPRYRTPFVAKLICLTVWTVAALLVSPVIVYSGLVPRGDGAYTCQVSFPTGYNRGSWLFSGFTLYSLVLGCVIPFSLIILFYFLVICKLRTVGPKNKSKEKKRSHRKVTYLVLTVITVYFVCWLPYWCSQIYIVFFEHLHGPVGTAFNLFAGCLLYVNSASNPILYAFLSDNFKKSFVKAFTCAAGKDVNATLHVENSVFPKATRCSSHGRHGHGSGGLNRRAGTSGPGQKDADDQGNGDTQIFVNLINQESHIGDDCAHTGITDYGDEDLEDEESEYEHRGQGDHNRNELRELSSTGRESGGDQVVFTSKTSTHFASPTPVVTTVVSQTALADSPLTCCGASLVSKSGENQRSDRVEKPSMCNGFAANSGNPQAGLKVDISDAKALLN